MNWYQGGIEEAVRTSRQKGAIFVVYVEGNDKRSEELTRIINDEQVSEQLQREHFVAIKVVDNSISLEQFRQIYKQVTVPSIFFIGKSGTPLEIITGPINIRDFLEKLKQVLLKHGISIAAKDEAGKHSENLIKREQEESNKNYDVVCENDMCTVVPKQQPSTSKVLVEEVKKNEGAVSESKEAALHTKEEKFENNATVSETNETAVENPLTPEEKIERAKELVVKTREAKKAQEEEAERQKEMQRRKVGQDVQKMKRWQQDNDLKELVEERNKEKKEQQAARQRVLDQIAQDKAERAAKFATTTSQPGTSSSPGIVSTTPPRAAVDNDTTRLQFRLPDGSSYTNEFSSNDTLQAVFDYILANIKLPFNNYTLSTTFPRREFTASEASKTLLELELTPSAVILILPIHGVVQTNTNSWLLTYIWSFIGPLLNFVGYLKNKIMGGASTSPSTTASTVRDRKRTTNNIPESSSVPKRRMGESSVTRRQGNVHRLADTQDSDDENNTWNGNSTQQM